MICRYCTKEAGPNGLCPEHETEAVLSLIRHSPKRGYGEKPRRWQKQLPHPTSCPTCGKPHRARKAS